MTATGRREGPCLRASLVRFRARLGGRASEAQSGVRSRQIAETLTVTVEQVRRGDGPYVYFGGGAGAAIEPAGP